MHFLVDPNSPVEDGATSLEHPIVVDKCWKGYSNHPYIWILAGPMTAALLVSLAGNDTNRKTMEIDHYSIKIDDSIVLLLSFTELLIFAEFCFFS